MKVIYVTDLHGIKEKYEKVYEIAINSKSEIVICGGDMFPLVGHRMQRKFILDYLHYYFKMYENEGIHFIFILGNDDYAYNDRLVDELLDGFYYIKNISNRMVQINGLFFVGMNYINDYPFELKDRCRVDTCDDPGFFTWNAILSDPVDNSRGTKSVKKWHEYVKMLPSMEQELKNLIMPENMEKSIYVIHAPPYGTGLDVCDLDLPVGSRAVYNFISDKQPLLCLHGHIHESPDMSGVWHTKIKKTIAIQPGQSNFSEKLIYVELDLSSLDFKRKIVNI